MVTARLCAVVAGGAAGDGYRNVLALPLRNSNAIVSRNRPTATCRKRPITRKNLKSSIDLQLQIIRNKV